MAVFLKMVAAQTVQNGGAIYFLERFVHKDRNGFA